MKKSNEYTPLPPERVIYELGSLKVRMALIQHEMFEKECQALGTPEHDTIMAVIKMCGSVIEFCDKCANVEQDEPRC